MLKSYTFLKGGSKHFLPPANGSCGKLMPLNLFVILFTGGGGLSPGGLCPGGSLSRETPCMVEEQAVRILLECIGVIYCVWTF